MSPSPWGLGALKVELSNMDAFRLPQPTHGLPSTGWLPANKLPAMAAQPQKLPPLPHSAMRLPLPEASQALGAANSGLVKIQQRPKVPRAEVGKALQSILAEQARAERPKPVQKALPAGVGSGAGDKTNGPSAPLIAKRPHAGLIGASKPAAQAKAAAVKQAGARNAAGTGASAKKPPLPAKRSQLDSKVQDKDAAAAKRPKPANQKQVAASTAPVVPAGGAASGLRPDPADAGALGTLPSCSQPMQASASPGELDAPGQPAASNAKLQAGSSEVVQPAAPRKRTQMADMDSAAVAVRVTSCAAEGKLASLTVPELKTWLKTHKLPVGGKKANLVSRLSDSLSRLA